MDQDLGKTRTWREKAVNHPLTQKALDVIYTTPIEIAIGGVSLMTALTLMAYNHYRTEANILPVALSEVGKTIKRLEAEGKPMPPITKIYSNGNDVYAKIAESNNFAYEHGGGVKKFASELEQRVDPALRIHRQLPEYTKEVGPDAKAALQSLDKFVRAANDLPPLMSALASSWNEDHDDVYKTEYYTEEECSTDSEGNKSCHSVKKSREVYDYTIHTYTYYPQQAFASVQYMGTFLQKNPDVIIDEKLIYPTKTDPENEYAIEKSMRKALDNQIPTAAQSIFYASSWATGSNFLKYQPVIVSNHASLMTLSPKWDSATKTAKSARYKTYSHSDSGPREFQLAKQLSGHASAVFNGSHKITDGITHIAVAIPLIEQQAKECIAIALDSKPGNSDKACDLVLESAKTLYTRNFENGLDVHPMKWGMVVAFGALGGLLGGLGGAGVDHMLNQRRRKRYLGDYLKPRSGRQF